MSHCNLLNETVDRLEKINQIKKENEIKTCCFEGCNRPIKSKGFCQYHYGVDYAKRIKPKPCEVEGCDKSAHLTGTYCSMHKSRLQRTGTIEKHVKILKEKKNRVLHECSVEGCSNMTHSQLCSGHRGRMRKYGKIELPSFEERRILSFIDRAKELLPDELFKKVKACLDGNPIDTDLAYEAQCEESSAASWVFNEEEQCEYWYMNLKDRDFIERDSATMNSNDLPF